MTVVRVAEQGPQRPAYPIIVVAKTHEGYGGEELVEFEMRVAEELSKVLCHPARFAIICDDSSRQAMALVRPGEPDVEWLASTPIS